MSDPRILKCIGNYFGKCKDLCLHAPNPKEDFLKQVTERQHPPKQLTLAVIIYRLCYSYHVCQV